MLRAMTTVQELKIHLLPRLRRAFRELGCDAIVQHQFSARYQPDDLLVRRGLDHAFVEIVKTVRATDVKRLTRTRTYTYRRSPARTRGLRSVSQKIMGTPGGIVFLALVKPKVDPNRWAGGTPVRWEPYDGTDLDVLALRLMERVLPLLEEQKRCREEAPARPSTRPNSPGRGGRAPTAVQSPPVRHDREDLLAFDAMACIASKLLPGSAQCVEYELNLAEDELRHGHDVATRLHLARTVEALLLGLVREWDASGVAGIFERVQSLQNQLNEIQAELARLSLSPTSNTQPETTTRLPPKGRQLIEGLFELYRSSSSNDTRMDGKNPPSINAAYHAIKKKLGSLPACREVFKELDTAKVIKEIVDDRNAIAHVRDVAVPGNDHRRANRMITLSKKLFDALALVDTARKAAVPTPS